MSSGNNGYKNPHGHAPERTCLCGFFVLRGQAPRRLFKLAVVQRGICAALGKQLCVAALPDDVAVVHKEDAVRVADGGEAVGDDKGGSALHERRHCFTDLGFGPGFHAGAGTGIPVV